MADFDVVGKAIDEAGECLLRPGQVEKAIDHYQQALAISREICDRCGEGNRLGNLGNAYRNLGQAEQACECWREALRIFEEIKSPTAEKVRGLLEKNCQEKGK